MRRNPFEDLEDLFDRLSSQFEEGMTRGAGFPAPGSAPVDVADTGGAFVVTVDLPGYDTDDVELLLVDGALKLEANRDVEESHEEGRYIRRERTRSSVSRRIRLPEPVEEDGVEATYNDGVLTVTLPKVGGTDSGHEIDIE